MIKYPFHVTFQNSNIVIALIFVVVTRRNS